jgi:predicted Zn-dependent protease with MMP-like domain/Flp pilus assembly protein TadD
MAAVILRVPPFIAFVLLSSACTCSRHEPSSATPAHDAGAPLSQSAACQSQAYAGDGLPACPEGEGDYLQRAVRHYDSGQLEDALACAAQASALEPRSADAQAERAAALNALGRLDEARVAYARALALEPDHADALLGAANLYLNRLPASRDSTELGLAYASRGHENARRTGDAVLASQFALLEATALNSLGRSREALALADEALAAGTGETEARSERASALWELCRFAEAKRELRHLLNDRDRGAWAHYTLGLLAEREADSATYAKEMATARALAPEEFPPEVTISPQEMASLTAREVAALPSDMKRDLRGVEISSQDLPDLEDLTGSDPPLSPAILGLFRGPSLDEPCSPEEICPGPCRSIVLYRKNLVRAVGDRAELERQVHITLIHEIGHLRGEGDAQLAARGLE